MDRRRSRPGPEVEASRLPESQMFVSDVRYLIGVVQVPSGRPVFRWNEVDGGRAAALVNWREQGGPSFQALLTGCNYEVLTPDAISPPGVRPIWKPGRSR